LNEQEEKDMKMLARIKRSADGPELIEYLERLSNDNYRAFKNGAPERNELCKGMAIAYDSLIQTLENCTKEQPKPQVAPEWP
jgi:hypothetical protein